MLNNQTVRRAIVGSLGLSAYIAIGGCSSGGGNTAARSPIVYVTDAVCNRVVQVNDAPTGRWTNFGAAGNGVGQFDRPGGIFQDPQGRLFIADTGNQRIVRIDGIGGANWVSFNGFTSPIGALRPSQAVTDAQGRIYIADNGGGLGGGQGRIVRIDDMSGANAVTYPPPSQFNPNPLGLYLPSGIALDSKGRLYVLEQSRLVRIDDFADPVREELSAPANGARGFAGPMGLFVDAADRIYVADTANNRIVRFDDMTGAGWTTFGTLGNGVNQFREPAGIFVDQQGRIYVTDTGNNRVVRLDSLRGDTGFTVLRTFDSENFCSPVGIY